MPVDTEEEKTQAKLNEIYGGRLDRIKELELGILREVDRICRKHDIPYFLVGGSLLGAVRHRGFIPWDDDLDIGMMRPDYERFRAICPGELDEKYFYQSYRTEAEDHYIMDKIRLKGTRFVTKFSNHFAIENGLFLDILVYDVTSDREAWQKRQCRSIYAQNAILNIRWVGKPEKGNHYLLSALALPFLKMRSYGKYHRKLEQTMRQYEGKSSGRWLIDSTGMNILKGAFPAEWFDSLVMLEFEGMQLPAPAGYDAYLRHWYGEDYMALPPLERRFSGHSLTEIDLGIYGQEIEM